jgi:26S proteasome regulatory subunit (ATPase 3-interacting protein)
MNRPYNVQILHDNLQGAIGKTVLTKILQTLCDDGRVTCKEFGKQKLFWRNQDTMDVADPTQIAELDKKIETLTDELAQTKEECNSLAEKLAQTTSLPSNKEADEKIASLTTAVRLHTSSEILRMLEC